MIFGFLKCKKDILLYFYRYIFTDIDKNAGTAASTQSKKPIAMRLWAFCYIYL